MNSITTRSVRVTDLDALAALEVAVWKRHGTPILTREDLLAWYEEESPYFLVAEKDGEICGYYFGRQVSFSPKRLDEFLDPAHITGKGFSAHVHDPLQDTFYGISVVATVPGVGALLNEQIHQLLETMGMQYFVGFTRLSCFRAYVERVQKKYGGQLPYALDDIALWYAHESAALLSMRVWKEAHPKPSLILPPLRRPDPVLAFHVRGTTFGLLAILPNYMPDPASMNYGAFIASSYPHLR